MRNRRVSIVMAIVIASCCSITACGATHSEKTKDAEAVSVSTVSEVLEESTVADSAVSASFVVADTQDDDADVQAVSEEVAAESKSAEVDEKTAEKMAEAAGEYYAFAIEQGGICIAIPEQENKDTDGKLTLSADGTCVLMTGGMENDLTWTLSEDKIIFMDETGTKTIDEEIGTENAWDVQLKDGIITWTMSPEAYGGEDKMISYFAKEGADTSSIETISVEEYQELMGELEGVGEEED